MKTSIQLPALILTLCLLFSCKKKDNTTTQPAYNSTMTAVVNGAAFTSVSTGGLKITVAGSTEVTLGGRSSGNQVITLVLRNYTATNGTFSVSSGNLTASYDPGSGATSAVSGSVIISSIDKTTYSNGVVLGGTFSFQTTSNTYQVTTGVFSIFLAN